ncbi:hypothetical protein LR69_04039 [Geobacillus sp. BCO2]|nr:hypothetical protein LR69_04039 [Geobacillus sp. BCO2]
MWTSPVTSRTEVNVLCIGVIKNLHLHKGGGAP